MPVRVRGKVQVVLSPVKCFESDRDAMWGQDCRSARDKGLIMGKNVGSPSCLSLFLSAEGNVKAQNTMSTDGLSCNWNVSFL